MLLAVTVNVIVLSRPEHSVEDKDRTRHANCIHCMLIVPVDRMAYRSDRQSPGICQNPISPVRLENVYGLKLRMLNSGGGRPAGSAGTVGISEPDWSFCGASAVVTGLRI